LLAIDARLVSQAAGRVASVVFEHKVFDVFQLSVKESHAVAILHERGVLKKDRMRV